MEKLSPGKNLLIPSATADKVFLTQQDVRMNFPDLGNDLLDEQAR